MSKSKDQTKSKIQNPKGILPLAGGVRGGMEQISKSKNPKKRHPERAVANRRISIRHC
jgi:hypothetical protein